MGRLHPGTRGREKREGLRLDLPAIAEDAAIQSWGVWTAARFFQVQIKLHRKGLTCMSRDGRGLLVVIPAKVVSGRVIPVLERMFR